MKKIAESFIEYLNTHQTQYTLLMILMSLSLTIAIIKLNLKYALSRKD